MLEFIALASMLFFKLDISKANEFELSDKVIPIEYDLIITPNLDYGTYTGTVHIIVNVTKFQNSITLHSKDLEIIEARINHIKVDISFVTEYDFLRLLPYKPVLEGTNLIKISFNGDMKDKTNGFYRAYETTDKEDKYFATTFFQPTNARVAFPCFDQPNFKARFSISIAKPHGYVALSNSNNIAETRVTNGYTYIRFAKTPPIPTHMVSLFIGDYEFTEDVYVKQNAEIIPVRIYASPVTVQKYNSLVQEIPLMLSWYANYTGFDYMLPELNYIAYFPKYDIYGRMENWGHLIENKNNPIFYNDMTSKLCKNFTLNVFHQVGHLWFEQLVTSSSWGEFWLTEGFVRFMDQKVADTYKECDQTLLLQTTIFNNALWGDDDIITAKPLSQEIKKPDDVYNILNYITYEKGCSVLMMLEKLIGEELMQKIIQVYIKKYQYQSVNSQEFVASVQSFVNVDISDFLDDFITQSGYPLITVELSENKSQVILLQEQFLRSTEKSNDTNTRWTIPITFITDIDLDPKTIWFNSNEEKVVITFPAEIRWIKLNLERSGYYRVNYPRQMWRYFSRIVKYLDVKDRINLIDDSMALVRSGHLHCSIAFTVMNYLYHEDLYEVWKVAENNFNTIYNGLIEYELDTLYLKTYVSELIDKQYRDNTWTINEAETFRMRNTRKTIFSIACFYGHEDCLRVADELSTIEEMLPDDIIDILTASGIRKNNNMKMLEMEWEMLGLWFGADLSYFSRNNKFIWPKQTLENCNRWLKDQYEI